MYFDEYATGLKNTVEKIDRGQIEALYSLLDEARKNGKHVFVLGNGGSAASASHWICDFGKGINTETSKRLKIFAPSNNNALFTALGNDVSYGATLSEQLKNFLEPGDLIVSFSVSGNSVNLLESHRFAKQAGAKTVCIVGDKNGSLIELSDLAIVIQSENYGIVEDIHTIIGHALSQEMRRENESESQ